MGRAIARAPLFTMVLAESVPCPTVDGASAGAGALDAVSLAGGETVLDGGLGSGAGVEAVGSACTTGGASIAGVGIARGAIGVGIARGAIGVGATDGATGVSIV